MLKKIVGISSVTDEKSRILIRSQVIGKVAQVAKQQGGMGGGMWVGGVWNCERGGGGMEVID